MSEDVLAAWRELGESVGMTGEELQRVAERLAKAMGDPTGGVRYGQDPFVLAKPPYRRNP